MIGRVESIGKKGVGIILSEEGVVMIEEVIDGELVEYRITDKKKSVLRGALTKIIESSPFRKIPECRFYKLCGGCNFQHIKYEHQLKIKKEILLTNLKKIGKYEPDFDVEIIPSIEKRYRTRTIFKILNGEIGFFKRGTNELVKINDCLLVPETINRFLNGIKNSIKNIDRGEVIILTDGKTFSAILKYDKRKKYLTEEKNVLFDIKGYKFIFTPLNFIQSNIFMLEKMISLLEEEISGKEYVSGSELFSGVGFFTVVLSKHIKNGFSYEISSDNIRIQKENFKLNSVNNIKTIKKDIYKGDILPSELYLIDPPRGGLTKKTIKKIVDNSPLKIIYFSCDSATFSRDLYYLSGQNYKPSDIKIIDNFPQTDHFEIFSVFEKEP